MYIYNYYSAPGGYYSTCIQPDEKLFPSIRGRVVALVGSKEID